MTHSETEPLDSTVVAQVFLRMQALYGHRWLSIFETERMLRVGRMEWGRVLGGVTNSDLERGFSRLDERSGNDRKWPPSAIEFRDLCLPTYAELGLPDPEDAYLQAAGVRTMAHPAVAWAVHDITDTVRGGDRRQARAAFFPAYEYALIKAREGFEFPVPPSMREDRKLGHTHKPADPAVVRNGLDRLKADLGIE